MKKKVLLLCNWKKKNNLASQSIALAYLLHNKRQTNIQKLNKKE